MLKSSQIKAAEPSQQEIAFITKRGEMRERKASSERKGSWEIIMTIEKCDETGQQAK